MTGVACISRRKSGVHYDISYKRTFNNDLKDLDSIIFQHGENILVLDASE